MSRLERLQQRRAYECRLTPDRALASLDEAEAFLTERGLLTRTADSSLPSLYEACHERPYAPAAGGFGDWPRTKWWWAGALAERRGVYVLKIHRGKSLFVTEETAALVDPICRAEIARVEQADTAAARLLAHLLAVGPSRLEDLRAELGLDPKELRGLRARLERSGAVVSRQLVLATNGGGHRHTSVLARWDQVFPQPSEASPDLAGLIVAGVRAAVVVPEREPSRWFSWSWRPPTGLVDELVAAGRLERPEPGWVTARELE